MAIKKPSVKHRADGLSDALKEAQKEKIKLFNIKLPVSKHTEFKALVVKNQDTMQDVLLSAIDNYLERGQNNT